MIGDRYGQSPFEKGTPFLLCGKHLDRILQNNFVHTENCIDGSSDFVGQFCGLLKQTQIQIDTVSSGYKALEMVRTKKYHIIFLDHMMPQMDGLETFKAMKQLKDNQNTETPVIMLTANAIVGVREKYVQEGFSDY